MITMTYNSLFDMLIGSAYSIIGRAQNECMNEQKMKMTTEDDEMDGGQ